MPQKKGRRLGKPPCGALLIQLLPQARHLALGGPYSPFFSTGNSVEASINFVIILAFFGMTLLRTLTHLTLRFGIQKPA